MQSQLNLSQLNIQVMLSQSYIGQQRDQEVLRHMSKQVQTAEQ